jgi:hypothetical protein
MKTYLEGFKRDWADFLQERTHYICQKLQQSEAYSNLEKAKEKAEQELREKLGEEGWKVYQKWYFDHEDVYSLMEGLFHDEHYFLGFLDGMNFANLVNGNEPFFAEHYRNLTETVETSKRLNEIGRDFRNKLEEEKANVI